MKVVYTEEYAPLFHQKDGETEPEKAYLYVKDHVLFAKYESARLPKNVSESAPEITWELTPYVTTDVLNELLDNVSEAAGKADEGDPRAIQFITNVCSFVEAELDVFTVESYYDGLFDDEIWEALEDEEHIEDKVILTNIDEWKKNHPN